VFQLRYLHACDNCYLVCPEPCIVRSTRSNGLYKILVDYCKGCRVCIEDVRRAASKVCLNWTSIAVWFAWTRRSPSRLVCTAASGRAEKSGGSAGEEH